MNAHHWVLLWTKHDYLIGITILTHPWISSSIPLLMFNIDTMHSFKYMGPTLTFKVSNVHTCVSYDFWQSLSFWILWYGMVDFNEFRRIELSTHLSIRVGFENKILFHGYHYEIMRFDHYETHSHIMKKPSFTSTCGITVVDERLAILTY